MEPSGYFTSTRMVFSSPGFADFGMVTVISPVFGSTCGFQSPRSWSSVMVKVEPFGSFSFWVRVTSVPRLPFSSP